MEESEELKAAREVIRALPDGEAALAVVEDAWYEECRGAGLYPQTLFHFTSKAGLLGILKSNFKITYSLEMILCLPASGGTATPQDAAGDEPVINREFGAPMVSFCDLRLSELGVHMSDYGSYGIGMSKRWAIENGVNPVYYISAKAKLLEQYIQSMSKLYELMKSNDGLTDTYHHLLNFYRYLKNYDAPLYRKGQLVRKNHRFANEREWRYVPPIDRDWTPFASKSLMADPEKKRTWNQKYESTPLVFEPKDINYVIVRDDDERDEIILHITKAKKKYHPLEVTRLKSRILTAKQIKDDV